VTKTICFDLANVSLRDAGWLSAKLKQVAARKTAATQNRRIEFAAEKFFISVRDEMLQMFGAKNNSKCRELKMTNA
jgi:hypothetical protein